jgi:hypothetical protein
MFRRVRAEGMSLLAGRRHDRNERAKVVPLGLEREKFQVTVEGCVCGVRDPARGVGSSARPNCSLGLVTALLVDRRQGRRPAHRHVAASLPAARALASR